MDAYPKARCFLERHQLGNKAKPDQLPLLEAALTFLEFVGHLALFRRILAYFLQHCGVKFPQRMLAALLAYTDRNLRKLKNQAPADMARHLQFRPEHNVGQAARVQPEHIGPLVEFLVARERTTLEEVQAFLEDKLGIRVSRSTVETTLQQYELTRLLRRKAPYGAEQAAPKFFEVKPGGAASFCSPLSCWTCFDR